MILETIITQSTESITFRRRLKIRFDVCQNDATDTDQSLDPVLVPLLKCGAVNLSQLGRIEADKLGLDLLQ